MPPTKPPQSQYAVVDAASHGLRLDVFLARRFGQELDLSRRAARAKIEAGSVFIGGKKVTRLSHEVHSGDKVELRLSSTDDHTGQDRADQTTEDSTNIGWSVRAECVIYEDEDLIAIDKPPGLPTQGTLDPNRHHLVRAVEHYLREQKKRNDEETYVGLHQRLDRETSGVIVMTKSRRANKGLADQISNHRITKIYNAISAAPEDEHALQWTVRNHLRKQGQKRGGTPARMEATSSGGDLAETDFACLEQMPRAWLIEARPRTGRMHQIRVHLADSGLPILGDPLYAAPTLARRAPRCMLHARELRLTHPVTGKILHLVADLPSDFKVLLNQLSMV